MSWWSDTMSHGVTAVVSIATAGAATWKVMSAASNAKMRTAQKIALAQIDADTKTSTGRHQILTTDLLQVPDLLDRILAIETARDAKFAAYEERIEALEKEKLGLERWHESANATYEDSLKERDSAVAETNRLRANARSLQQAIAALHHELTSAKTEIELLRDARTPTTRRTPPR